MIVGEAGIEPGTEGISAGAGGPGLPHCPQALLGGSRILQLAAAASIRSRLNGVAANSRPAERWPGVERLKRRAACRNGGAASGTWNTAVMVAGVRAVTWEARTNLPLGGCQVSRRASFCGDSASHGVLARARGCTSVISTAAMPAAITGRATPARIRPAVWALTSGVSSPGPLRRSRTHWDGECPA